MSPLRQAGLFGAVAFIALALGYLVFSASRTTAPKPGAASGTVVSAGTTDGGPALMVATLPDLAGRQQPLAQWRGKVLVVNFWATWCAPCREEIPALIQVQEQLGASGLQIVGIAIDQPDRVKPYAAEMGINYPILVGELEAIDLSRAAGNEAGGLPFTVIIDRAGYAAGAVTGRVTAEKLLGTVRPLL